MMWNHRVVRIPQEYTDNGSGYVYSFQEVYYNSKGQPYGYAPICDSSEDLDELKWLVKHLKKCLKRPVLTHEEIANNEAD